MSHSFYPHIPITLLKSEIKKYHKKYPEYIHWIRSTKSRNNIGCDICENNNLGCPCQQQHLIVAKQMYDSGKALLKKTISYSFTVFKKWIYNSFLSRIFR